MNVPAVPNPEPGELKLRSYLADVIDARDRALERVAVLEREKQALWDFALSRIEDAARLLPGETIEQRLDYLLGTAAR